MDQNLEFSFDHALEIAQKAVDKGREVLLNYFGKLNHIDEKHLAGLVTEADLESEKVISEILSREFPEISILGEESHFQSKNKEPHVKKKNRWIIDPLDGTTNYVHRFPVYCISIGLEINGKIQVAVIDAPAMKQNFSAIRGQGAYLNGNSMSVSQTQHVSKSLLATGFFPEASSFEAEICIFHEMLKKSRGVRRAGAAAYDLCMVASGVFDAFWERNLNPWDTAAGFLLVEESGGKVTNFDGETYDPFQSTIVASNKNLHSDLIKTINTCKI